MPKSARIIVRAGLIAGLYVVLSLITFPVASGFIQFRLSEALTLLPLFFLEAVPALFVGCALSNLITGCTALDVVFGSLITLIAGLITYAVGKIFKSTPLKIIFGGLAPVVLNAIFLPLVWLWAYGQIEFIYIVQVAFLTVSQTLSVYGAGTPLTFLMKKHDK